MSGSLDFIAVRAKSNANSKALVKTKRKKEKKLKGTIFKNAKLKVKRFVATFCKAVQHSYPLRFVFTSDGVGVLSGVVTALMTK